jgi:hypothetical protein
VGVITVSTSFWQSCQKEGSSNLTKEVATMSNFDCDEESDGVVNTAALGIVELAKNASFRTIVHNKIQEQFDGDDDVLLKTLSGLVPNMVETMRQSVLSHKDNITLSPNLSSYKNFQTFTTTAQVTHVVSGYINCSNTIYTQIYIPFIGQVNLNSMPVIAIGYKDVDDCVVPGYQIQFDGEVKLINVDEDFAKNNLVWVVSINERVNQTGVVESPTVSTLNSTEGVDYREGKKEVKVDSVKIFDKKECWLCGKAEVSFVGLQAKGCDISGGAFAGYDFISIGNSDLNKWKKIAYSNGVGYMALDPENPLSPSECLGFVLYEKDHSKKKWEQKWTFSTCASGGSVDLYYYSKQTPYGGSGIGQYCYSDFTNHTTWTQLPVSFSWTDADLRLEAIRIE